MPLIGRLSVWSLSPLILFGLPLLAAMDAELARSYFTNWGRSPDYAVDFATFVRVSHLANPFADGGWRWSPVAAWITGGLFVPLGFTAWQALSLASLAFLWRWPLLITGLLLWPPLWADIHNGNSMTFVTVTAVLATASSRPGIIAFYAMVFLMPRPLMLPILVWLLWTQPWSRRWFLALGVVHLLLVLLSGQAGDWAVRLASTAPEQAAQPWTWSLWELGPLGITLSVAAAVLLTRRGWLGLAGLLLQPYLILYYASILAVDARRVLRHDDDGADR